MNQSDRPSIDRPASIKEIQASVKEAEKRTEYFAQATGKQIKKLPEQSIAYAWEFFIPRTLLRLLLILFIILIVATIILFIVLLISPHARSNSELTDKILFNLAAVIVLPAPGNECRLLYRSPLGRQI